MDLKARIRPLLERMATSGWFAKVGPKVVPRIDRGLSRLTGGRVLMSDGMIPTLVLTTTGHKSGQPRQAPLACLPEPEGSFIVVGSNFGRAHHPAWSTNLLADPAARVRFHGRDLRVHATLLEGEDRAEAWERVLRLWPPYDRYTEKSGRELRVFRLSPVDE
ncbi:nitroreductase family deazaflavin-dependent oxidoreductase [Bailinhaonella thermotolerans]|uniref:Nitroreductase family deazaflavin-dependent oxidoreductase n=1 Tax=Bailinhaonella thermotolerans TaxID=1070861 RepID=A0A3A4B0I6_9ACTN|nr:nitroreductase family deazaflavin-dependent oxidoreductase [Bailinhaonella thermotolerans]RJL31613.1 nitroreductase family deazaflavin-dependent oxidoreductase [Bailinhaonella thermotolerans]